MTSHLMCSHCKADKSVDEFSVHIGNIGSDAELCYLPESPNDTQTDTVVCG